MTMRRIGVVWVAAAIVLASCGGGGGDGEAIASSPAAPVGTRLTAAQANALSQGLFKNFQAGGAQVTVTIPYGSSTFTLDGDIDWKRHVGAATVTTTFRDGVRAPQAQAVFWSRTTIVMPLPGLEAAMAERGRPGVTFLARPLDGSTATLDRVVAFIDAIASDRPENPLLLRQRPEVVFLGREDVEGTPADRYQSSESAQFWLAATGGRIVRVSANFAGLEQPVDVRLRDHGPRSMTFPGDDQVVLASDIPDLVAELTDAARAGLPAGSGQAGPGS